MCALLSARQLPSCQVDKAGQPEFVPHIAILEVC